ncbi:lasso peptide biosynthesis B2 protein [Paenibacillus ihuae]|uniref:lasso peptide biosynthesis B2 protein n=1 Tax=Paenibacillus ihuae TaxID=1232431 RepID=UPI0006D55DEE|nr:lasso peptide biosynthesis B2 protein [Paenibacillus ihuae]
MLLEACFYLAWARIFKLLPFSKVSSVLGKPMEETSWTEYETQVNTALLHNISYSVHLMSRYVWWESMCLVKAIAIMKMLERRRMDSTLYLGTSRDVSGKLIAHAWLRSGSLYLAGQEEMDRFTVALTFSKTYTH